MSGDCGQNRENQTPKHQDKPAETERHTQVKYTQLITFNHKITGFSLLVHTHTHTHTQKHLSFATSQGNAGGKMFFCKIINGNTVCITVDEKTDQ